MVFLAFVVMHEKMANLDLETPENVRFLTQIMAKTKPYAPCATSLLYAWNWSLLVFRSVFRSYAHLQCAICHKCSGSSHHLSRLHFFHPVIMADTDAHGIKRFVEALILAYRFTLYLLWVVFRFSWMEC